MEMTVEQIKESQSKLSALVKCAKCKDTKKFLNRDETKIEICKEC